MIDPINSPRHTRHAIGFLNAMEDRKAFYRPDPAPRMRRGASMLNASAIKDWHFVDEPDRFGWKSLRTEDKAVLLFFVGSIIACGAMLGHLAIAVARAEGWLP